MKVVFNSLCLKVVLEEPSARKDPSVSKNTPYFDLVLQPTVTLKNLLPYPLAFGLRVRSYVLCAGLEIQSISSGPDFLNLF